jgi:outer membrane receptor protein involved in Fe transport
MKKQASFKPVILSIFILLATASLVLGQATTATLSGSVKDPSGAVLPGVEVGVNNVQTGQRRATVTDDSGNYLVPLLPVGEYEISFELPGFQRRLISGIVLQIDQRARVDATLELGEISEQVTVQGVAPLVESKSSEFGEVIEQKRVVEMPLNGRQFVELAFLTPAVSPGLKGSVGASMQQTGSKMAVRGSREYDNVFMIDGIKAQDHFFNTLSVSPSVDAIQEFKVETSNFSADKGERSGGQINIAIKSGTNDFHGSVFEFVRNDIFDARNFFDPDELPPFRQNQFGFTIGGPIVADKVFFFGNYEGLRIRQSITRTFSVPTAALRSGDLSASPSPIIDPLTGAPFPGNIIPSNRIHPTSQAIMGIFPQPNLPGEVQNLVATPGFSNDSNQFTARIDATLSESDSLFGRLTYSDIDAVNPFGGAQFGASNVTPPLPGFGLVTQTETWNFGIGQTHVFSPRLLNDLRFGFNRVVGGQLHENAGNDFNAQAGIGGTTTDPDLIGIPNVTIGSFAGAGDQTVILNNTDTTWQFSDGLTFVYNDHQLKFGGELQRISFNPNIDFAARGSFVFTPRYTVLPTDAGSDFHSLADFLLGFPSSASVGLGDARVFGRSWNTSAYVQDDWTVSDRLTVNLGVRWDYFGRVGSSELRAATFDFSQCGPIGPDNCPNGRFVVPSKDGRTASDAFVPGMVARLPFPVVTSEEAGLHFSLYERDLNNFAPRIGLAYRVGENTVVRAGYGIYYNLSQFNQIGQQSFNAPLFDIRFVGNDATPATGTTPPTPLNTTATVLEEPVTGVFGPGRLRIGPNNVNFPAAYSQQWSLNIQHSLTPNLLAEIAYIGSKGTRLQENNSVNNAIPGPGNGKQGAWIPELSAISYKTVGGYSNFHSLILRTERRFSSGLAFVGSYTWSKSLDRSSATESFLGGGGFQTVFDMNRNKGPSNFDITHNFVTSVVYEIPLGTERSYLTDGPASYILGGWQVSGILSFRSGQPLTPSIRQNRSNAGGNRPDRIGDGNLSSSQRSAGQWFDPNAFAVPALFTYGNTGRGVLKAPNFNNVDLALMKTFPLWYENHSLQFRAEFFNLFNQTNLDFPTLQWDSASFGRIFSAGFSRQIQFALKYIF